MRTERFCCHDARQTCFYVILPIPSISNMSYPYRDRPKTKTKLSDNSDLVANLCPFGFCVSNSETCIIHRLFFELSVCCCACRLKQWVCNNLPQCLSSFCVTFIIHSSDLASTWSLAFSVFGHVSPLVLALPLAAVTTGVQRGVKCSSCLLIIHSNPATQIVLREAWLYSTLYLTEVVQSGSHRQRLSCPLS